MQVETVPLASLVEDPANARKHAPKNLEAIKGSLARFGQQKPIVVGKNNVVIAGNGTLRAALSLGWERIEIRRSDLEGTEATAFALADNRSGELAEWDAAILGETLQGLLDVDFDVGSIGFDLDDLAALLPTEEPSEGLTDPDELPEAVETRAKPGDLWMLGRHRVLCGDSTNVQHVDRLMGGEKADMIFTDPPYGIGYEYASHDDSDADANKQLVADVFALHPAAGKVWTPGLMNLLRDIQRFGKTKLAIWYKKFAQAGNGIGGASTWEPILILNPTAKKLANDVLTVLTERESVNGVSLRELHSCPKPVNLYEQLITALSEVNEIVHEPFCGSGTTLIACEKTGRRCFGMEIDPHYCDVIITRWEAFTGFTATLETGCQTDSTTLPMIPPLRPSRAPSKGPSKRSKTASPQV